MVDSWSLRKSANKQHLFEFLMCIADISDAANELKSADQSNAGLRAMSTSRRMSVPLRKILLDGNGYLFKSCFTDPSLHPLRLPAAEERPITIAQLFKRPAMNLGWADGITETIEFPEYEQRTTIHPLYGIRHCKDQEFIIEMPFNYGGNPLKFRAWMNAKVIEVDGMMFTAKDLLREIVNNEGAHIGDGTKLGLPSASTLSIDSQKNERYRAVNAVKFGTLSYAQIFCIWTGLYIADRSKDLIDHLPFNDSDSAAIADLCKKIDQSPKQLSGRCTMENQTYHMFVLGSDRKLRRESIGDYSTLMKIP